jgi:cyclopropane fatty-acyl-phospholipid synthase-like methyltransferase
MRTHLIALLSLCAACAGSQPRSESPAGAASDEHESTVHAHEEGGASHHHHHDHHHHHEHGHHEHGYAKDFSAVEAYAAHFDSAERDTWQKPDEVVRLLEIKPGSTVVDLGAGTGYFVGRLSTAVGEAGSVLALDTEPNMVRYLEQRAQASGWKNVRAQQVPPDDPQLEPQSVDRILIVNTWHHISHRNQYAAKLREALREGGMVMIVDFTRESDLGPPPQHRLDAEQVVRELEAGGLSARVVEEGLEKQYVVVGRR